MTDGEIQADHEGRMRLRKALLLGFVEQLEDLAPPAAATAPDRYVFHAEIERVSGYLYRDGHYKQAALEAYIRVIDQVKLVSGLPDDGDSLMNKAFGGDKQTPVIQFNSLATEAERDEQRGIMYRFKGIVQLRNSKAHSNRIFNDPSRAHEYLALTSLLLRLFEIAQVNRGTGQARQGQSEARFCVDRRSIPKESLWIPRKRPRGPNISTEKARAMKLWKCCARPRQNPGLTSRICQEHHSSLMIRSTIRTGGGWTMIQMLRLARPRFHFYFCMQIHPWVPVRESVKRLQSLARELPNIEYAVVSNANHEMMFPGNEKMQVDQETTRNEAPQAPSYFIFLASWLTRHVAN